jgi:hypothetical protein
MLSARSDSAALHKSCTIYGEAYYSWDESFGLSFLRLNKGANVIRGSARTRTSCPSIERGARASLQFGRNRSFGDCLTAAAALLRLVGLIG